MGSGQCAVCGNERREGHKCRLTYRAVGLSDNWWNRLTRRIRCQGLVVAADGSGVWACDHRHETSEDALLCGRAQLELRQDPETSVDQMDRPRMRYRGDVAGFHARVPGLSQKAWEEVIEVCRGVCRYCGSGGALEREHRIPISREGPNRISNIVAACKACNLAKRSATEKEYLKALRRAWGERVPQSPRNLDKRLGGIERRYAADVREERGETLLRSLDNPNRMWDGLSTPKLAVFAVHRQKTQKLVGVSFRQDAVERALGRNQSWEGRVALVPQPTNPHDSNAVAIVLRGDVVGYLPAHTAQAMQSELVRLLRSQQTAVVTRLELWRWEHGVAGKTYLDLPFKTRSA